MIELEPDGDDGEADELLDALGPDGEDVEEDLDLNGCNDWVCEP